MVEMQEKEQLYVHKVESRSQMEIVDNCQQLVLFQQLVSPHVVTYRQMPNAIT